MYLNFFYETIKGLNIYYTVQMNHKIFHYYPVDVKNSYTGVNVKGFKFPANGTAYDVTNAADVENLQQMQIYFYIH